MIVIVNCPPQDLRASIVIVIVSRARDHWLIWFVGVGQLMATVASEAASLICSNPQSQLTAFPPSEYVFWHNLAEDIWIII